MRIYRVSETAIADMGEAYEYVARDNEGAAEDLLSEFQKRFRLLADFPSVNPRERILLRERPAEAQLGRLEREEALPAGAGVPHGEEVVVPRQGASLSAVKTRA